MAGHAAEDASASCLVRVGRSGSRAGAAGAVGVGVAVMSAGLVGVPCVIQLETIMGAAQMSAAIVRLRLISGSHCSWGSRRKLPAIWAEKLHFATTATLPWHQAEPVFARMAWGDACTTLGEGEVLVYRLSSQKSDFELAMANFELESSSWPEDVSRQEGADAGRHHHTKRVRPPCRASTPASLSLDPDWHSICTPKV